MVHSFFAYFRFGGEVFSSVLLLFVCSIFAFLHSLSWTIAKSYWDCHQKFQRWDQLNMKMQRADDLGCGKASGDLVILGLAWAQ